MLVDKSMWLQAAGRIHTDFEKGFIMAEVMKFAAFKVGLNLVPADSYWRWFRCWCQWFWCWFFIIQEHGSEAAVKAAGGYRQQGKNYIVEDGDIIFFKVNFTPNDSW